jgi:hypothetical protein
MQMGEASTNSAKGAVTPILFEVIRNTLSEATEQNMWVETCGGGG